MSDKDKGGSAFPRYGNDPWGKPSTYDAGMTLRDHFAGLALEGMLAGSLADGSSLGEDTYTIFPQVAYRMADAMIVERSK